MLNVASSTYPIGKSEAWALFLYAKQSLFHYLGVESYCESHLGTKIF